MKRDGFTIIEVMIFLAISGLMLAMAMIGSGNLARQARFSDTVNGLHSTLQRQYEDVANGVNTRQIGSAGCSAGSPQPGSDDCLLLGKVISFVDDGGTNITTRYITGTPVPVVDLMTDLIASNPRVRAEGQESIDLAWGATFQVASRHTARSAANPADPIKPGYPSRARINNIAFIRSPNSSQIVTYFFYSSSTALAAVQAGLTGNPVTGGINGAMRNHPVTTGTQATICVTNKADWSTTNYPVAAILFGAGQGAAAIDTGFNPSRSNTIPAECNS
ncbi:MAG: prepilin-type N-terminal cleavage/methylation domain-containing protein [Candidatus Saccharimonadales bacterium]